MVVPVAGLGDAAAGVATVGGVTVVDELVSENDTEAAPAVAAVTV